MKEENEKVIIDETFVLKFEDSTQPAKRIKLEPTDPDAKESKVLVDAITQTDPKVENGKQNEASDAILKVEIATQTDLPPNWDFPMKMKMVETTKLKNGKNIGIFKVIPNGQGYTDEEDSE